MTADDRTLALLAAIWLGIMVVLLGLIPALSKLVALMRRKRRERRRAAPYRTRRFID